MKWLAGALLLLLVLLQYRLWLPEGSVAEQRRLERQVHERQEENAELAGRNERLEQEVLELQTGTDTVEEIAREDLGMIRDGETYYHVDEPETDKTEPETKTGNP